MIDGEPVTAWYVVNPGTRRWRKTTYYPAIFTPEEEAALKEIGYSDWYHWSLRQLGHQKWNACHGAHRRNASSSPSPPMPKSGSIQPGRSRFRLFHAMIEMFPKLSFTCELAERG